MESENQEIEEVLVIEVIEIEEYVKAGKHIPLDKHYKIRIDKEKYIVKKHTITRLEILELAKKTPPQDFMVLQKFKGGEVIEIEPNAIVDLSTHHIERFMTAHIQQNEGAYA